MKRMPAGIERVVGALPQLVAPKLRRILHALDRSCRNRYSSARRLRGQIVNAG